MKMLNKNNLKVKVNILVLRLISIYDKGIGNYLELRE
jgi:hypothetical protein